MKSPDTNIVYFHGKRKIFNTNELIPSVARPFYICSEYNEAMAYASYTGPVYPIYIREGIKMFDFTNPTDVKALKGRTYYSDKVIDRLADEYGNKRSDGWNLWRRTHSAATMEESMKMLKQAMEEQHPGSSDLLEKLERCYLSPINHNYLSDMENPKSPEYSRIAKELAEFASPMTLSDVVAEKMKAREKFDYYLLAMMIGDTIQAIAEGKYPYDFMTYRRIIYRGILDIGCEMVKDTNTTGSNSYEYVLLSRKAIRLILSKPISPETAQKYDNIKRIVDYFDKDEFVGWDNITIDEFDKLLAYSPPSSP